MRFVEPGSDQLFIDLAVSIEERTTDRALDRLNRLIAMDSDGYSLTEVPYHVTYVPQFPGCASSDCPSSS